MCVLTIRSINGPINFLIKIVNSNKQVFCDLKKQKLES